MLACATVCLYPHTLKALTPSVLPLSSDPQIKTFIPTWQGFSCIANLKVAFFKFCSTRTKKAERVRNTKTHFKSVKSLTASATPESVKTGARWIENYLDHMLSNCHYFSQQSAQVTRHPKVNLTIIIWCTLGLCMSYFSNKHIHTLLAI